MPRKRKMVRSLFWLIFVFPMAALILYYTVYSKDQYRTNFAFSVKSEDPVSAIEFFSAGPVSPDSDILVDFIKSQKIVETINKKLDLYSIYNTGTYDPFYHIEKENEIEYLVELWQRMVQIFHDKSAGIVRIEVFAFTADDAYSVSEAIIQESRSLINKISNISEDDKISHVENELNFASTELKDAQEKLTNFRKKYQIVDPNADFQNQIELIKILQEKYIDSVVDLELMQEILEESDPRVRQAQRKINVLGRNIELEKEKIGLSTDISSDDLVSIFDEFEKISINIELSKELYSESRRAYAAVLSEVRLKDKYLAVHVEPALAESSEYPRRIQFFLIFAGLSLMTWFISCLVYYSIRDRY